MSAPGTLRRATAGRARRAGTWVIPLAVAALLVPSAVVAKSGAGPGEGEVLELVNDPEDMVTGRVWTAELRVRPPDLLRRPDRPAVLILDERTGDRHSYPVRRAGDRYTADVVFPEPGRWAYGVAAGDRFVAGREHTDVTAAPTRSDATVILAVSGFLVLGAAVLAVSALRHRPSVADASASG